MRTFAAAVALAVLSAASSRAAALKTVPRSSPSKTSASVDDVEGGVFKVGEDIHVHAGKTLTGSLVAIGGSASVDGAVDDDVVVIGGDTDINGRVAGNVIVLGTRAHLGPKARIEGEFVTLGATVAKEDGAKVLGETVNLRGFGLGVLASAASTLGVLATFGLFFRFFSSLGWLFLAVVAALAAPRALDACATALRDRPLVSLLAGLVFGPGTAAAAVAMLLSLVGIPLLPLLAAAVAFIAAWGYLAAGQALGRMLARPSGTPWLPCFIGVAALQIAGWVPVLGQALGLLALVLGIGATLTAWIPKPHRS